MLFQKSDDDHSEAKVLISEALFKDTSSFISLINAVLVFGSELRWSRRVIHDAVDLSSGLFQCTGAVRSQSSAFNPRFHGFCKGPTLVFHLLRDI